MPRGYDRALYILPFDHRGSFQSGLFGWSSPLSDAQTAEIAGAKQIIYDGFRSALAAGVPDKKAGILVDEQFGGPLSGIRWSPGGARRYRASRRLPRSRDATESSLICSRRADRSINRLRRVSPCNSE
jgi:hypothetical protein